MHPLVEGFLDLLFPPRCTICRRFVKPLICPDCAIQIVPLVPPLCHCCGQPLDPLGKGGDLCADCRGGDRPFDLARAFGAYETVLRKAIHRLKYEQMRPLARPLGEMAAQCFNGRADSDAPPLDSARGGPALPSRGDPEPVEGPPLDSARGGPALPSRGDPEPVEGPHLAAADVDFICPVPLHPVRQRQRGFNQSELIARRMGEQLGLAVNASAMQRIKPTVPQIELTAAERRRNVRGAFAVENKDAVAGKSVLLFDDVWTTGATLTECAKVLRRAGAARVLALTVARAVRL